jgi:rhamnulose-1-phosphate aldolase/alcohol dehydrogenase
MKNRWNEKIGGMLDGLDALVYASRIIGQEPSLVLWGGGNSSAKVTSRDHMGRDVRVLWIKGSGSDMRTITADQFTPLLLDQLLPLMDRQEMTDEEMVSYQNQCMMSHSAPRPSIETLLHAFLPAPHIYHTHADAICALTDTSDSAKTLDEVYGGHMALVPYVRPGFQLAKLVLEAYRENPSLRAIILDKHGLVTWGDTPKAAYLETIRMVSEAERFIRRHINHRPSQAVRRPLFSPTERGAYASMLAPLLRGAISRNKRMLLAYDDHPSVLRFVDDPRAELLSQIGPFTPDHLIHTKAKPLFLMLPKGRTRTEIGELIHQAVDRYRDEYVMYFERYKPSGVTLLDPYPRVILVEGIGMFTSGKNRHAARITHDLYRHTIGVIRDSSAINSYTSLSPKDLCEFEYWPLENFKLTLLPPEKQLSRRIALVTGAAGAIGRAIASKFMEEGCSVILTDISERKLQALSGELNERSGEENTVPICMDVTDPKSVSRGFERAMLAYGGLDILVSNAGIARSAPVDSLSVEDWRESFAVNSTGHFLVCREAMRIFKSQALGGNIVVVATKNILAPGKDFAAYSASKAAQAQLARVLAIEGAEFGVRVNIVNPDAVFDGSGIWSDELRKARAKAYGIPLDNIEAHCVARNLLKVKVTAADVAEAVLFLASDRSAKTTGAIIPVDGGIKEAFPR